MSKRGHIPIRMCLGCRQRKRKEELIRLIRTPDGLAPAKGRSGNERGFYLCRDWSCLKKARKRYSIPSLPQGEGEEGFWVSCPVERVN